MIRRSGPRHTTRSWHTERESGIEKRKERGRREEGGRGRLCLGLNLQLLEEVSLKTPLETFKRWSRFDDIW